MFLTKTYVERIGIEIVKTRNPFIRNRIELVSFEILRCPPLSITSSKDCLWTCFKLCPNVKDDLTLRINLLLHKSNTVTKSIIHIYHTKYFHFPIIKEQNIQQHYSSLIDLVKVETTNFIHLFAEHIIVLLRHIAVEFKSEKFSVNIGNCTNFWDASINIYGCTSSVSLNLHTPRTLDHVESDCTCHESYKFDRQRFLLFLQHLEWPRPLLPKLLLTTSRMQNVPLQNASWRYVFWRRSQEKIVYASILWHIHVHFWSRAIKILCIHTVNPLMWDYFANIGEDTRPLNSVQIKFANPDYLQTYFFCLSTNHYKILHIGSGHWLHD